MKKSLHNPPIKLAVTAAASAGLLGAVGVQAQNNTFTPGTSAITPITQSIETGPILDVVPYVLADGYTINLALIPSDTEFAGYDTLNLPQVTGNLNVVELPTVLPRFTVRQLVTTVNVWDNQTVVLGGLITSTVSNTKNSVPVLGDLPFLGRLFTSQTKTTAKDNLMIFVTTTIVDPAGSRVHSDDELPFALSGVPVQAAENVAPVESVKTVSGLPK
jgi:type II secretory pathway component GspD/PulD (secretin)